MVIKVLHSQYEHLHLKKFILITKRSMVEISLPYVLLKKKLTFFLEKKRKKLTSYIKLVQFY